MKLFSSKILKFAAVLTIKLSILAAALAASEASAASRLAIMYPDGTLYIKEGGLNAPYAKVATCVKTYAIDGNRVAIQYGDGKLYVKDGPLNAAWTMVSSVAKSYQLSGNRIAVLYPDGTLYIKEGGLNAPYTKVATCVKTYAIDGDRVAIQYGDGKLYVKDSPLNAAWTMVSSVAKSYQLSGNRIAVLYPDDTLYVKEGGLSAPYAKVATCVKTYQITENEVAIQYGDRTLYLKQGSLFSSWTKLATCVSNYKIDGNRVAIQYTAGGTLYVRELPGNWVNVSSIATSYAISVPSTAIATPPSVPGNMSASENLLDFLAAYEGYSAYPYQLPGENLQTIGYGHQIQPGENFTYVTEAQARDILRNDIKAFAYEVNIRTTDLDLAQCQFDALVSFVLNCGPGSLSSPISDYLRSGTSEQIKQSFLLYVHDSANRKLAGLYLRRYDEWEMYTTGNYSRDTRPVPADYVW